MSESSSYEIVMPFVTVKSKGGPHDDEAYAAGYECGRLDAFLAGMVGPLIALPSFTVTVSEVNVPQLDLIAMRHGFTTIRVDDPDEMVEGWVTVRFEAGNS